MVMTPEAKGQLSKTIRALRTRLLEDFKSANDSTYKYSIRRIDQAKLSEANATRRRRIEEWIAEQVRGEAAKKTKRTAEDFRRDLEKQAAYTLLNRMLILRLMDAMGLHRGDLVAKGWNSAAYKSFRYFSQEIVRGEESEGYSVLLQMVFDDLAIDMPGLYGNSGISDLIPVPTKTLRAVVDAFAATELESCWTDDMTLGWVYQYWNDPEREALDDKLNEGGKIELHEIASKTQMFTERYMVDWLLQNSLGPIWMSICSKNGWTALVESTGTLNALEQRRVDWRAKRDAEQVSLTDLMPLYSALESQWAYYVPQEIPTNAIENAPDSVRLLKILDPAVGSGHFLVAAFDLLYALYLEEAEHRGQLDEEKWSTKSIVESILENNLCGIDIDARAVQIAASAIWIKAKTLCRDAQPSKLNLVSSNLGIGRLSDTDEALLQLRNSVELETAIPTHLTNKIIEALRGADHLGSLLKVNSAVENAVEDFQSKTDQMGGVRQLKIFPADNLDQRMPNATKDQAVQVLLMKVESFLKNHSAPDELGLRLHGEQLASGLRFFNLLRDGQFDLVIGNPPYQAASKLSETDFLQAYAYGKSDLFSCFIERSLQLVKPYGVTALLTMRNWMFTKQFQPLREYLCENFDIRAIGDFAVGAFEDVPNDLLSVAVSVIRRDSPSGGFVVAQIPSGPADRSYDRKRTRRKVAATLCGCFLYKFKIDLIRKLPGKALVYWWPREVYEDFKHHSLLGDRYPVHQGLATSDNNRFIFRPWETCRERIVLDGHFLHKKHFWAPHIKGADGKVWCEPLDYIIKWKFWGLELRVMHEFRWGSHTKRMPNEATYLARKGVAFATIGDIFSARVYTHPSVYDAAGCTVFADDIEATCCLMNSTYSRSIVTGLNPTMSFTNGDIERIPLKALRNAKEIFSVLYDAFEKRETHREASLYFRRPGPSPWIPAQQWAQYEVDREDDGPVSTYSYLAEQEPVSDHLSFAIGVALGRFHADGAGIIETNEKVGHATSGFLFLDGTLEESDNRDGLGDSSATLLHQIWERYRSHLGNGDLRRWLRLSYFNDVHRSAYDSRPIYFPISSRNRTFVVFVNVHRWSGNTLRTVIANCLLGEALPRIDGELEDLRRARAEGAKESDSRFLQVQKWKEELDEFIALIKECGEKGPPTTDDKCPKREVDVRYEPDIDDGVLINSAALWPLLEPQWKDPKKWWKELAVASSSGNKDYDWSHLAMRYFPKRVDEKCKQDPSLGVAHGCFWKYHPAKAWAWELRLQDEVGPDFSIEESSYRGDGGDVEHRAAYLRDHAIEAIATIEKEVLRRRKDAPGKIIQEMTILESGLWSSEPEACWDMETRIIKKQEFGFRLIAPDEAEARAKLIAESPQKETGRRRMLEGMSGSATYLAGWEEAVQDS
jgi:hypothetical protein